MIPTLIRAGSLRRHNPGRISLLISILTLIVAGPLHAAEAGSTESPDTAEPETSEPAADTPTSEVFIPTEEISEDFAVSFPVDI